MSSNTKNHILPRADKGSTCLTQLTPPLAGVAFAGILFIILMISVYIKSRKLKGLEAGQALRAVRENNHAHEKARLKDAPALREFAYMLAAEKARRDEKAAKSIALGKARKEVAQLPDTDD